MAFYKNKASQKIAVYAHDTAADAPKTGDAANITAQISKDGAATAATDDVNPTELDATDAPGIYIFDMTQAETNADLVILSAVSGTADVSIEPVIAFTQPEIRSADVVSISGDATAADNAEAFFDGTGYAGTNNVIPSVTTTTNLTNAPTSGDFTATMKASIATELATYDAPTNAEMVARTLASADYATASLLTTVAGYLDTEIAAILADTNELQTNQGNWLTATGFATPTNVTDARDAILTQGNSAWITATGFSTHSAADVVTAMGTGTFLTAIPWNAAWDAEVQSEAADALAAFSWSTTAVILTSAYDAAKTAATQTSVNTVDTVVDTIAAVTAQFVFSVTNAVDVNVTHYNGTAQSNGDLPLKIDSVIAVTNRLNDTLEYDGALYQFTANALELAPTGGSAPSAADIRTEMDNNSTKLAAIVADTNELQLNQGQWLTATGFATPTTVNDARDAILTQGNTAWVTATGFSTFNAATDEVTPTTASKTGYALSATGLDALAATTPDSIAAADTWSKKLMLLVARFFNRVTRDSDEIKVYRDDGVTVATTQTYTASGSDEDVGEAS